ISLGGQVEHQYTITNPGGTAVNITSVLDDKLGELADGGFSLDPGESTTIFKTATIFADTTNAVTVTAEVPGGVEVCSADDSVTVTVVEPPPGPFVCKDAKPIDKLTMIWNGTQSIRIKAWKGNVGSTLLADMDNIAQGAEVTVSGFAGSPNDVIWEIFAAGTDNKLGESTFHLSCSDGNMNGPEDCGKPQGDGKDKAGFINDWLFEGMAGSGLSLDCTP
ncbi:MAG: hypothetical protein JRJ29_09865, partial [Deltaproteobacteria bacterium]|nr:hypothetical protein [Deltaproteobacteria bacterium]